MCLTLTARVEAVADDEATVVAGGRRFTASRVLEPDTVPGDWVSVGAGWILARLTPDEAAEQLSFERVPGPPVAGEIGGRHDSR